MKHKPLKLTDTQYKLPQIHALAAFEVLETGTTEPMAIRGVDREAGTVGHYVVKYINSNRMSVKSSCRELLGAWMANEMDIKVVEPVIVHISKDFVDTISGQRGYQAALKSVGINFGSLYEEGYIQFENSHFELSDELKTQAQEIFMFDMFIANADRGAGKPNVLSNGKEFIIFDHELAFSFVDLLPFMRNNTPWIFGPSEKEMYEKHYLYPFLRKQEIDFTPHVEKLASINNLFWEKVFSCAPAEWQSDELNEIKSYLDLIIDNREEFAQQLTKILAA